MYIDCSNVKCPEKVKNFNLNLQPLTLTIDFLCFKQPLLMRHDSAAVIYLFYYVQPPPLKVDEH